MKKYIICKMHCFFHKRQFVLLYSMLSLACYCCDKLWENNLGKKGLFQFIVYSLSGREVMTGTQGRNVEAGSEAEDLGECCWLVCSPWLVHPVLLYIQGPLSQGWHWPQRYEPCTLTIIQENFQSLICRPLWKRQSLSWDFLFPYV